MNKIQTVIVYHDRENSELKSLGLHKQEQVKI